MPNRTMLCLLTTLSVLLLVIVTALAAPQFAAAQTSECADVIDAIQDALAEQCQTVEAGMACYATDLVEAAPDAASQLFFLPGDRASLTDFDRIETLQPVGAAVMVVETPDGVANIVVFGDADVTPEGGNAFTLRDRSTDLVCEQTPSGMMVQTPAGGQGVIVVNGVEIQLGSTVFVAVDNDTLFNDDPRMGSRGAETPFCAGFASDCNYSNCALDEQLLYGPRCRDDRDEQIAPGLYRVVLEGRGRVRAAAFDRGTLRGDEPAWQRLNLPGDFTFCWSGMEASSAGFETVVEPLAARAAIDRVTVQYLGADCDAAARASGRAERTSMVSIYNMEGDVALATDVGFRRPAEREVVRIFYDGDEPMEMDRSRPATQLMTSPLLNWMTFDATGMPTINQSGPDDGLSVGNVATSPPVRAGILPANEYIMVTAQVGDDLEVEEVTVRFAYSERRDTPDLEGRNAETRTMRLSLGRYRAWIGSFPPGRLSFVVEAVATDGRTGASAAQTVELRREPPTPRPEPTEPEPEETEEPTEEPPEEEPDQDPYGSEDEPYLIPMITPLIPLPLFPTATPTTYID